MDVFATYWQRLTGTSDGMPGFLVEEGGMEKLVIVAISIYLLRVWHHVTFLLLFTYVDVDI